MADEIRKDVIISVQTDTSQASEGISELKKEINDIQNISLNKSVKDFRTDIEAAIEKAKNLGQQFGTSSNEFKQQIDNIRTTLSSLSNTNLGIDINTEQLSSQLDGLTGEVNIDITQAEEQLDTLQQDITSTIGSVDEEIIISVNTEQLSELELKVQATKQALIEFQNTGGANVTQLENAFSELVVEAGGLDQALSQLQDIEGFDEFNRGIEEGIGLLQEYGDEIPQENFENFKTQIKEARLEAEKLAVQFGTNSKEFINAAQNVAELEDNYDDFKKTIQSFNPDNKLQALTSAARGAVGAIQGVQGAMTFLGVESETAQESIAKLQALMAFSNALNSVEDIKKGFSDFGKVIKGVNIAQSANNALLKINAVSTNLASKAFKLFGVSVAGTSTAFKVLKGAIISTGIGALIVGLGLLIEAIIDWTSSTDDQVDSTEALAKAEDDLKNSISATNDELSKRQSQIKFDTDLAVIQLKKRGASEDEVNKKIKEGRIDALNAIQDAQFKADATIQEAIRKGKDIVLAAEKSGDKKRIDEAKKTAKELEDIARENAAKLGEQYTQQSQQNTLADEQEELRRIEAARAEAKRRREQAAETNRESKEQQRQQEKEIRQLRLNESIRTSIDLREQELNNKKQEILSSKKSEEEKAREIRLVTLEFIRQQKQDEINLRAKFDQDELKREFDNQKRLLQEKKKRGLSEENFQRELNNLTQVYNGKLIELNTKKNEELLDADENYVTERNKLITSDIIGDIEKDYEERKKFIEDNVKDEKSRNIRLKQLEADKNAAIAEARRLAYIKELEDKRDLEIKKRELEISLISDPQAKLQAELELERFKQTSLTEIQNEGERIRLQNAQANADSETEILRLKREQQLENERLAAEEEKAILDATYEYRQFIVGKVGELISGLGGLLKEGSDLQKAFAITEVVIGKASAIFDIWKKNKEANTVIAAEASREVASIYAKYAPIPGGGILATAEATKALARAKALITRNTVSSVANTAIIGAQAAKTISDITSGKGGGVQGGGNEGGGAAPQLSSTAPSIQATATQPQEIQNVRVTNQPGDQVVRAYITDRDLRNNESRTRFLNQLSTF